MSYISVHTSKGIRNTYSGNQMTWWKTNFNMPVPDLYAPSWSSPGGYFSFLTETTSYDLTGFNPGWELLANLSLYHFDGALSGTAYINAKVTRPDSTIISTYPNSQGIGLSLASGYWSEWASAANIGICPWEVNQNGTYPYYSWTTGVVSMNATNNISITNCPSTSNHAGAPGYIWVDTGDNGIHYICADDNGSHWGYSIVGVSEGYVGTAYAGYMWIGTDNWLHWVGYDGYQYHPPFKIQQFASTWTNGPGGVDYAGTSKAGYVWMDNQFGQTHISYIGYDGYKYLTGNGHDPYINPY